MLKRLLLIFLYIILVLFLVNKLTDPDLWWHLGSGKYILESGAIPKTDVFSYTAFQNRWIDLHWLFQLIIYLLYKFTGVNGIIFLQMLIVAGTFSLFFLPGYKSNRLLSAAVFLAVILVWEERFLVRPEIFSILFIGLYFHIIDRYKNSNKNYVFFIPVLQVLWVNIHSLFILGPLLIAAYLIGEFLAAKINVFFDSDDNNIFKNKRSQKLLFALGLAVCVCFINPYGYRGIVFPYELFQKISLKGSVFSNDIFEFQKPFSIHNASMDIQLYKVIFFLSLFSFLAALRRIKLSVFFVYLLFLYLSVLAKRNIGIFALVAGMVTVDNFKGYDIEKKVSFLYVPAIIGLALLSISIATNKFYLYTNSIKRFGLGVSDLIFSDKACNFIKENKLEGNIFNDLGSGGYLIWRLFPDKKVFIDGRLEVYGNEIYNAYNGLFFNYPLFKQVANNLNINCIIWNYNLPFMPGDFWDNVIKDSGWKLVCVDNSFIVFVCNKPYNDKVIKKGLADYTTELVNHHQGHEWRGAFFEQVLKLPQKAEVEYERAIRLNPDSCIAHNNLGNIYNMKGLYDKALAEFETAIRLNPENAGIYANLGTVYSSLGDYDKAIKEFLKGLRRGSGVPQLWLNLGSAYEQKKSFRKAVLCYRKALKLSPDYEKARVQLVKVLNEIKSGQ